MGIAQPPQTEIELPRGLPAAALRGIRGVCPRCGDAALFRKWIKPINTCGHCHQDWSIQQADDFPAYIGIFISGHLLAPVVIAMIGRFGMSPVLTLAIVLPLALVMCLAMLQPSKGAVIAFLWWFGVGGFVQERRDNSAFEKDEQ